MLLQHFSKRINLLNIVKNSVSLVQTAKMSTSEAFTFKDIEGDLFSAPKNVSLAHCVAADLKMGAGIAVKFKQLFGQVEKLKSQNIKTGGVAILKDNERYIYYLVTKDVSYSKPTYQTLKQSLEAMKMHIRANNVEKLAMPRIGCGLDGLEWDKVSAMIREVFKDEKLEVTVYTFVPK